MRGDASRASAIQYLEKARSSWFTAHNALPNSGRSQHPCFSTMGTPWTNLESRGFFRWLGLFKEQSHSTGTCPCRFCKVFWSQGNFVDPSVFSGRCWEWKGICLKVLSSKSYGTPQIHIFGWNPSNSFGNAWFFFLEIFKMEFSWIFLSQTLGKYSNGPRVVVKNSGATTLWARRLGGTTARCHGGHVSNDKKLLVV